MATTYDDLNTYSFDEDYESFEEKDSIKNDELVKCIILEVGHTSAHIKEVEEYNKKAIEEAKETGVEPELKTLSYKEGGVSAKVAVIQRLKDNVYTFQNGEPNYSCYTQITQIPPAIVYERKWGGFCKGVVNVVNGNLVIKEFMPSAFEAKDWNTGGIDGEREAKRREEAAAFIKKYEALTEEEAKDLLLKQLAQRFLLLKETGNSYSLQRPRTGLVFQAKVRRKPNSNLFDLTRFAWNQLKREWEIYGEIASYWDEESEETAFNIIAERERAKIRRNKAKAEREAQIKQDEEVPF